jgi:hypothetical protein
VTESLESRLRALEAHRATGILLLSWRMSGDSKAVTELDGVRHVQADVENREQFLDRVAVLARRQGRAFLWVSEEDEQL